jgi:hypothetical protein
MSFELFNLLPAVYRIRDAQIAQSQPLLTPAEIAQLAALQALTPPLSSDQQALLTQLTAKASRGPLESLLLVIQEQLAILANDLDQLYDDEFIETCAQWVIPYIGDLIGYQSVKGIAPAIDNPRAEVAETISLRRRKGTILVMEQLARDATGWSAHAVEFFRFLADTQYMNHVRLRNHYAPDLRRWQPGIYVNTGFDHIAHKVDVRRIEPHRGRYNIQNIGIFLWSLSAYSITGAPATPATASADGNPCFRFSSLGMDMPLFHLAVSQGEEITAPAEPVNVVDRLRRRVLCADLQKGVGAGYYGEGNSLAVFLNNVFINPYQIQVADLSGPEGSWANMPPAPAAGSLNPYQIVIDPELGRMALPPTSAGGTTPTVNVSYYYGFNADMGGGEYPRADGFLVENAASVFPFPDTASPARYNDLPSALNYAVAQLSADGEAAVEIAFDNSNGQLISQTYQCPAAPAGLSVNLPPGATLELRAADESRPTVLLTGEISVSGGESSIFCINGLVLAAAPSMTPGSPTPAALVHVPVKAPSGMINTLSQLQLTHCTLVPGWSVETDGTPNDPTTPTLIVEPSNTEIVVENSVLGAVRTTLLATFNATNSIIDSCGMTNVAYAALDNISPGGALTLEGCTVVGKVHATLLSLISDTIFWGCLSKPACLPVALNASPFSSVYYTTAADAAGDMLVVGTPNPANPIPTLLNLIPVPNAFNQQICGSFQIAPGDQVNAYVPTAAERAGNFSAFAATFVDPNPLSPYPIVGGIIPPERTDVWAWRIAPTPSDPWPTALWSDRKQEGCVRFSFLPIGARTPRQFECVQAAVASPQPLFFSTQYGHPGYLKLFASTPKVIRRGADDGGEMGAFHFVLGPLRESDLKVRMQEYLPVGMEFGVIYQN